MVPAKVTAVGPTDFNIGTLSMMKVYMSKADSTDEVLGASHTDTTLLVGNSMALVLIIQTF